MHRILASLISVIFGLMLTGCVTIGSSKLSECLADPLVTPKFMSSSSPNRILVGGLDADGATRCYWSDDHYRWVQRTAAWKECKLEAGNSCAIVADKDYVTLNFFPVLNEPRPVYQQPANTVSPNPSIAASHSNVIWTLIGEFAEGFVAGYAGAALVATPAKTVAVTPPTPTFRCTPANSLLAGAAPTYVCH